MSYGFEAAPRVISNKPKYKEEEEEDTYLQHEIPDFKSQLQKKKGTDDLTPQEQEDLRIKEEREKKKVEMIKKQLVDFKKSKTKKTPYDLRPGPPARIEVDLTYFLTEQGNQKPAETSEVTQTDQFLPKPPSPKYVPKKTGIDEET